MVLDRKELMKKLFHPGKSRQENAPNQDEPVTYQEPSFTNEGRAKTDGQRARRNDKERSRSTLGRSSSKQERSKENRDYDSRSNQGKTRTENESPKSKKDRLEYVLDKQKRKQEHSIVKRDEFSKTKYKSGKIDHGHVVKVALPISNASKLDAMLFFFPRFHTCCCCLSLKTGCFLIGWTQVVGCLIVGGLQSFIALICFEHVNPEEFFNNFPDKINPARAVSEFADDYCAGLSVGYATGEFIGFVTGMMLLVAVWKDLFHLIRLWIYGVLIMLLPTITFYGVALYAMLEYRSDVPMIAVPSFIELVSFVVLCYCASIVKSYYYTRVEQLFGMRQQEPTFLQEPMPKRTQEEV